jgi:hypothetical protein
VFRSIDDGECLLEKHGYADAFTSQKVLDAIHGGPAGKIAMAYVEFASDVEARTVIDWTVIADQASARAFVTRLQGAPRSFRARTAIGARVDHAMRLLADTRLTAARRVIDVCGDGINNAGREVGAARDEAVKAGITISGLAIINDHPASWTFAHVQPAGGLANYYRDHVAGGTGSFVLEVHDFSGFGEAMTRKLVDEIAGASQTRRYAGGR